LFVLQGLAAKPLIGFTGNQGVSMHNFEPFVWAINHIDCHVPSWSHRPCVNLGLSPVNVKCPGAVRLWLCSWKSSRHSNRSILCSLLQHQWWIHAKS